MVVEQEPRKDLRLSLEQIGSIADSMIEFALVPNRRVVLEGADLFLYNCESKTAENGEFFHRNFVIRSTKDGVQTELAATSERNGKNIAGGELDFSVIKNGRIVQRFYGTQEAGDKGWELLKSLAFTKR